MLGRDIDPLILENLEDIDLVSYCKLNKEANKICNDQTFWYNRLRSRFPQIDLEVMAKVKTASWSDVYIQMVQFVRSVNTTNWLRNKEEVISFQDKNEALTFASQEGHIDIVKYLVENGADIHARNDWALIMASENGHLDIVKYLVNEGADIHVRKDWALRIASEKGHLDIVKYLVNEGADIHARDDWALRVASRKGHVEVVKFLKSLM